MSLRDKLIKNSTIQQTALLPDSIVYANKDIVPTEVPMINVALSGSIDGGLTCGLTMLAGPSKHFKSGFALLLASAFLKKYPDGMILYYDSEFGMPQSYFKTFGINMENVVHTPVTDIEQLKHDISVQIQNIERNDKVIIIVDSIGNLASKKETDDAMDGKTVADMSRAKALKSLFRIITPTLTLKNIPMIAINHTYQTIELYSKSVVSGGCVVSGTKIKTSRGLVEIQDVQIGDSVVTTEGYKEVTHTWNPETLVEGMPECYEVEFEDGYKVIVSENHRFLSETGWVSVTEEVHDKNFISVP